MRGYLRVLLCEEIEAGVWSVDYIEAALYALKPLPHSVDLSLDMCRRFGIASLISSDTGNTGFNAPHPHQQFLLAVAQVPDIGADRTQKL
ncbi:MAG: hypothetical protein WCJ64_04915 [Rhodospirillaceae bacterium]